MKQIKAYIHHVRAAAVIEALGDAGYRNVTLHDVKGMLRPITMDEREYAAEAGGLVISEVKLSLVVDDAEVDAVTSIVRTLGRVGSYAHVCGYVYVSSVEQALPIGGPE